MRLFLVRHGETESNRLGLALGQRDVSLNDHGRWQAERLAAALAREGLAAVYSSPLQRCLDTARPVAERHGLDAQIEDGLIEMDIGEADGLTFAEVRSRFPGLLEEWGTEAGPQLAMPGGERLVDVQGRAWSTVEGLARRHADGEIVAVTHNFVILSLLAQVLQVELSQFRRLRHAVAAISVLDLTPRQATLVRMNDTCHLDAG